MKFDFVTAVSKLKINIFVKLIDIILSEKKIWPSQL